MYDIHDSILIQSQYKRSLDAFRSNHKLVVDQWLSPSNSIPISLRKGATEIVALRLVIPALMGYRMSHGKEMSAAGDQ